MLPETDHDYEQSPLNDAERLAGLHLICAWVVLALFILLCADGSVMQGLGHVAQLRLYFQSFWHFAPGRPVAAVATPSGLGQVPVPTGKHTVIASFQRADAAIVAGGMVCLLGLLGLFIAEIVAARKRAKVERY